jgi:hypothetical protein
MTRTFLIATVAALALTAPAQAERGGNSQKAEREQKAQKAQEQRGGQRAERSQSRQQVRAEAPRQERAERVPRQQVRQMERRERPAEARAFRQVERRTRQVERRERPAETRAFRQVERRDRSVERRAVRQVERQQRTVDRRAHVSAQRAEAVERRNVRRVEKQERRVQHDSIKQLRREERQLARQERTQRAFEQPREIQRQRTWESLSSRIARIDNDRRDRRHDKNRLVTVGQQVSPDWFADYTPLRYASYYQPTSDYYYRYDYDNGYRYQIRRDDNFVSALFPILGGAYSVGRPMPFYYDSYYNVPFGYSSLYYDTPDYYYRYGDGAIYQVDPSTQLIAGIVALLTGQSLGIGQTLPLGYDVYNVPYAYRSSYYDTDDMWYRYDDGYIYGVDPRTRLIETSYPVYGGYMVGAPWPSYAGYNSGYDYAVPDYYDDLYYAEPGYDYRYASNGIYQVDPQNQLIAALVALVTGQNFGVGQRMPLGYDVYNVPIDYRDRYYDNDDYLYRYADGRIYQVDPGTRLIERIIIV